MDGQGTEGTDRWCVKSIWPESLTFNDLNAFDVTVPPALGISKRPFCSQTSVITLITSGISGNLVFHFLSSSFR